MSASATAVVGERGCACSALPVSATTFGSDAQALNASTMATIAYLMLYAICNSPAKRGSLASRENDAAFASAWRTVCGLAFRLLAGLDLDLLRLRAGFLRNHERQLAVFQLAVNMVAVSSFG